MTPEQFCYWLQGSLELTGQKTFDENQVEVIKDHLSMVLKKETIVSLDSLDISSSKPTICNIVS